MQKKLDSKLLVNRIVSFLAGGLLIFAIMSFTVVNNVKTENQELTKALDSSQFEAGRLLTAAKAQFEDKSYDKAQTTLKTLFENQPGTTEAAEGRELLEIIKSVEKTANENWEAAMPNIQNQWMTQHADELRAELDQEMAELEEDMEELLSEEWDKVKTKIRDDWEEQNKG
ncbi:MAG: hypothetical protein K9L24_05170 [Spirochaetia bacterium]|nr:hypothetical protein [Spirochaetia bacterium]